MITGIGTDICQIDRIAGVQTRSQGRLAQRILTSSEYRQWENRTSHHPLRGIRYLASRFAAKEALSKALGLGMRAPMSWQACSVQKDTQGKPFFVYDDTLKTYLNSRGWIVHLSLSDEHQHALAFVVIEQEEKPSSFA
jgi:holo-[acyl-carrier protein] synthase